MHLHLRRTLSQNKLTGTGRSVQDHPPRDPAPVLRVHLRLLQEVHDLDELDLGAVAPGHVIEVDPGVRDHLYLRLGLAHPHGIARSSHPPHARAAAGAAREEEEARE